MMEMSFLARVLLKILFFPLTRILIAGIALVLSVALEGAALRRLGESFGLRNQAWFVIVSSAIMIATAYLVYVGYVRLFERRAAVELSRKRALPEFAIGAAIGFALITATIVCLWLGGFYRVQGIGRVPSAAVLVVTGLFAGFWEEILIRGVIFRITEESLGTWLAMMISALLFGLSHLFNPESSPFAALCISLEAGVLLAAAYITTRRLWLPIGLHFAWNFTQGGIFGVAVSGQPVRGLLKSTLVGPPLLSGGAFGAESSIFAVVVCTSMAIFLLVRAVRNGQIIRPFWSRKRTEPIPVVKSEPIAELTAGG
jgi:uncharacterized protein